MQMYSMLDNKKNKQYLFMYFGNKENDKTIY